PTRPQTLRRGRPARRHAEPDARQPGARPGGRAAVPRRCVARAPNAADGVARQRGVPRAARCVSGADRRPRGRRRPARAPGRPAPWPTAGWAPRRGGPPRPRGRGAPGAGPPPRFAADDVAAHAERGVVVAEESALERAVSTLVENARRHGPAGGRVTVTVSAD